MAGDWIKMRADLQRHPKVVRIASACNADRLRTVGGLHAVWCLFDEHSEDGLIEGYTPEAIDDLIGWPGFSRAMIAVGWLEVSEGSCCLPRFDEHNGQSAKRRAMETQRKRREREAQAVPDLSASDADKKRSREDKREDKEESFSGNTVGGASAPAAPAAPSDPAPAATPAPAPTPRASRLPEDWQLPKAWGEWALAEFPHWTADVVRIEAAKFADHWRAKSGKDATKADWLATWRNWCRSDIAQRAHQPRPGARQAPPPMDTEARNAEVRAILGFDSPANPSNPPVEALNA